MSRIKQLSVGSLAFIKSVRDLTNRERQALTAEILQVRGLMPLLMKPRNKQRWNVEDKAELVVHVKRLSRISPYLVVLVMPGWSQAPSFRAFFTNDSIVALSVPVTRSLSFRSRIAWLPSATALIPCQ